MITAHVSLGNMEKQWKLFTKQMIRTHQLLPSLIQKPAAPTQLVSGLEAELLNLNSIYTSYQPIIQAATELLQKEPSFVGIPVFSRCIKRSLLPFLGDALSWLTGTATTKDVNSVKARINQLISTQHINIQCYQIYYPNKQATYQHLNGYNREDTSRYNNPIQYHAFSIQ